MYSGLVSSIYLCSVIAAVVIELVGVVGAEDGSQDLHIPLGSQHIHRVGYRHHFAAEFMSVLCCYRTDYLVNFFHRCIIPLHHSE